MNKLEEFARIVISKRIDIDDLTFSMDYDTYFEHVSDWVNAHIIDADQVLDEQEYNICMEVIKEYGDKR